MSTKSKKKAQFADKLLQEIEIQDALTEDMIGAIQIHLKSLKLRAGEVESGTRGVLTVSYGNHLIGKVDYIPLPPQGGVLNIDYKCFLQIGEPDDTLMDAFVATPFFFTLSVFTEEDHLPTLKKSKSVRKQTSSRSLNDVNISQMGKQASHLEPGNVLGQGNLDILPLLLEGGKSESTVLLEMPVLPDTLFFSRHISENPSIVVSLLDVKNTLASCPCNNIMWLTVESIFNPSEPYLLDDAEYTLAFPIPRTELVLDEPSSAQMEPEGSKFKEGDQTEFDSSKPTRKGLLGSSRQEICSLSSETISSGCPSKGTSLKAHASQPSRASKNLRVNTSRLEPIMRGHAERILEQGLGNPKTVSTGYSSYSISSRQAVMGTSPEQSAGENPYESLCFDDSKNKIYKQAAPVEGGEVSSDRDAEEERIYDDLLFDAAPKTKGAPKVEKHSKSTFKNDEQKANQRTSELNNRIGDYTLIEFPQGCWSEEPQLDLRKTWVSLASICGGPAKHAQQIKPDSNGIFSKFEVNLRKKMLADSEPKIVWNMVRPYWLNYNEQQNLIKKIFRHGVWPVEVIVNGGSQRIGRESPDDSKRLGDKEKSKKKSPISKKPPALKSYIAWLDLSPLLFPGSESIRVTGQLQVFDKNEGDYLWGLQSTIAAKPAEPIRTAENESYSDNEKKVQNRRNYIRRDSTKKIYDKRNLKQSTKKDKEINYSEDSDSDEFQQTTFLEQNVLKNKPGSSGDMTSNLESLNLSEGQNNSSGTSKLQFDSFRKAAQKYEAKGTRYVQLEKDYQILKDKYDKMVAVQRESIFKLSTSEDSAGDPGISDILSATKENAKRMKQIIQSEMEEKELQKLLVAKDALDTWTVLEHKKLLMERYALASLRKKMKEDLILFEPEKFYNEDDEPIFIVIEIKFLKALIPKHSLEKIEADVRELLPDRKTEIPSIKERYTSSKFQSCLAKLTKFINLEYRDFVLFGEKNDEESFFNHLINSRAHQRMTELLREGMAAYVQDVVGTPLVESHIMGPKWKDYIGWLYCRLMDEIHSVVNKFVMDADRSTPLFYEDDSPNISKEELLVFTTEAAEERDYNRVKFYISKILSEDHLADAQCWSDYAVICLRLGDYPKAVECLREALALDIRHKESLLMYAVILTMAGMFDAAELFFYALVDFHPFFLEGWITFHTFYLLVERSIGADAALIHGTKCSSEHKDRDVYKPIQLAWDNSWEVDIKSHYLNTAVYLLSFNLYEMAEVCLAQELENTGEKSEMFIYYLAVCHHIQGRYQDSSSHLSKALSGDLAIQADPRLWIILGHNKWQLGKKKEAVHLYMEAISSGELSGNLHMAYIRAGYYFLEIEKADLAQQMFLRAVTNIGTPMGWLGLGISLYMQNNLDDAELALKEANTLDNRLAVAWAYLGLICLQRNKMEQFQQCIHEAKMHGLNDLKLKTRMEDCLKKVINQENTYYSL